MLIRKGVVLSVLSAAACGGGGYSPKIERNTRDDGSLAQTAKAELGDATINAAYTELPGLGCTETAEPKPFGRGGMLMMKATCGTNKVDFGLVPGIDLLTMICKAPVDAAACDTLFTQILRNIHAGITGGKKTTVAAATAPALGAVGTSGQYSVADLPGTLQCWSGPATVEITDGPTSTVTVMLRRAWEAATSTVHEETVSLVNGKAVRSASTYKVTGQAAVVSGAFSGKSELKGDAGAWTGWVTTVSMPAGGRMMTGTATATVKDKALHVATVVQDDSKKILVKHTSDLSLLDDAACKSEFSKIPPK